MTLRLVMTRDVGGDQMAEAFKDALGPRVAQAVQRGMAGAALSWALFDVYLGDKPISSEGKKTVIARLPEILRGS